MKRRIGVVLLCVFSAVVMAVGADLLKPLYNFRVVSLMGETFNALMRAGLGFLLGAYLGAVIPWFFSKREKEYIPLVLVAGVVLGLGIGTVAGGAFVFFLKKMSRSYGVFVLVIPFGFSFLGAWLGYRLKRKMPQTFRRKIILALSGVIIIGICLFLLIFRKSDFPRNGSIEERHAWAVETFQRDYPVAVEYVKSLPEIQQDVGSSMRIAPDPLGINYYVVAPGDPGMTFLTLEVRGEKGTGQCALSVAVGYSQDDLHKREPRFHKVIWEFQGRSTLLKEFHLGL